MGESTPVIGQEALGDTVLYFMIGEGGDYIEVDWSPSPPLSPHVGWRAGLVRRNPLRRHPRAD